MPHDELRFDEKRHKSKLLNPALIVGTVAMAMAQNWLERLKTTQVADEAGRLNCRIWQPDALAFQNMKQEIQYV